MQLEEELQTHLRWSMGVKSILYAGKSKFQAYELVDSYTFGKVCHSCSETQVTGRGVNWRARPACARACADIDALVCLQLLMLDGKLQSAESDERAYHECLVQPAMLLHPNPKTVFICGGMLRVPL